MQFSVNLTATALHDEHFIKFVGLCAFSTKSALPRSMIAFEVDAATAVKLAGKMAAVGTPSLHRLGCPLVLDGDFSPAHGMPRPPAIAGRALREACAGDHHQDAQRQARAGRDHRRRADGSGARHAHRGQARRVGVRAGMAFTAPRGSIWCESNSMSPPESIRRTADQPPPNALIRYTAVANC